MYKIINPLILSSLFILSLATSTLFASDYETIYSLKPFKTDLCTSYPEGTRKEPMLWAHCCIKHDLAYWVSGTRKDMKRADRALKSCVTEVAGAFRGTLMYRGVRAGHYSPIKGKYHWSWAWPKARKKYLKLSKLELDYVMSIIYDQEDVDHNLLEQFIDFRF